MAGKITYYNSGWVDENPLHLTTKSRLSRFKKACKDMYLDSRVDCGDYVIYKFGDSYSWNYDETRFKVNVTSEYHIRKDSPMYQDIDLVLSTLKTL